jgi:hypothetical protein
MSKLVLSVNTEKFVREEREEYGTVREAIAEFATTNKLKGAKMIPVNAKNLGTEGKQILLVITEVNAQKKPANLKVSDTIHVGKELSDEIRSGEQNFSGLLDCPLIHHTNESNGVDYPLIVRPTLEADPKAQEMLASFELTAETEVSKAVTRDVPAIEDILSSMQV